MEYEQLFEALWREKVCKPVPIRENQNKGFHYTVTDEQIAAHQKLTLRELFEWLESANRFVSKVQTPEEKRRSIAAKNFE